MRSRRVVVIVAVVALTLGTAQTALADNNATGSVGAVQTGPVGATPTVGASQAGATAAARTIETSPLIVFTCRGTTSPSSSPPLC